MDCNMNRNSDTAADDTQMEIGDAPNVVNPSSEDDVDPHLKRETACDAEAQNPQDTTNVATPEPLFKGDIVCSQEVFEWLSLKDIHAVGQTCKRLQAIAGDFFKCYLPAAKIGCVRRGLVLGGSGHSADGFRPFVQKLDVWNSHKQTLRHIASMKGEQLKEITFSGSDNDEITRAGMNFIKETLNTIEAVNLHGWEVNDEFYNCHLQFCPNLKHLIVHSYTVAGIPWIGICDEWFAREYPNLVHVDLYPGESSKMLIPEVKTFFERNSQIKKLSVDLIGLWYQKEALLKSKIQLDNLVITILSDLWFDSDEKRKNEENERKKHAFDLLHQLHEQGFYKQLRVRQSYSLDERVVALPGLEMLTIHNVDPSKNSGPLTHVKELTLELCQFKSVDELYNFVSNLPNLERLYLHFGYNTPKFNYVLPFLQHCPKLNNMNIKEDNVALDLSTWNKERAKLADARKVTIFVYERGFLAAKWSNATMDLEFIEIRRADS